MQHDDTDHLATDTDDNPFDTVEMDRGLPVSVTSPGRHQATYKFVNLVLDEADTVSVAHGLWEESIEVRRALVQLLVKPRPAAVEAAAGGRDREDPKTGEILIIHERQRG